MEASGDIKPKFTFREYFLLLYYVYFFNKQGLSLMFGFILHPIKSAFNLVMKIAQLFAVVLFVVWFLGLVGTENVMSAISAPFSEETPSAPISAPYSPPASTAIASSQVVQTREVVALPTGFRKTFVDAALAQEGVTKSYDASYHAIPYPWGDVPSNTGVCTDVVVRALRNVGIDLQMNIHNDMKDAWSAYPRLWHSRKPDRNIDHRRVPNVMVYLTRIGKSLALNTQDYQVGDIVAWKLAKGQLHQGQFHIGIVSNVKGNDGRFQVVHNPGQGVVVEDVLHNWEIIGHYRYFS
jgi:uncharacterized protein YijF (DUF1287 family)